MQLKSLNWRQLSQKSAGNRHCYRTNVIFREVFTLFTRLERDEIADDLKSTKWSEIPEVIKKDMSTITEQMREISSHSLEEVFALTGKMESKLPKTVEACAERCAKQRQKAAQKAQLVPPEQQLDEVAEQQQQQQTGAGGGRPPKRSWTNLDTDDAISRNYSTAKKYKSDNERPDDNDLAGRVGGIYLASPPQSQILTAPAAAVTEMNTEDLAEIFGQMSDEEELGGDDSSGSMDVAADNSSMPSLKEAATVSTSVDANTTGSHKVASAVKDYISSRISSPAKSSAAASPVSAVRSQPPRRQNFVPQLARIVEVLPDESNAKQLYAKFLEALEVEKAAGSSAASDVRNLVLNDFAHSAPLAPSIMQMQHNVNLSDSSEVVSSTTVDPLHDGATPAAVAVAPGVVDPRIEEQVKYFRAISRPYRKHNTDHYDTLDFSWAACAFLADVTNRDDDGNLPQLKELLGSLCGGALLRWWVQAVLIGKREHNRRPTPDDNRSKLKHRIKILNVFVGHERIESAFGHNMLLPLLCFLHGDNVLNTTFLAGGSRKEFSITCEDLQTSSGGEKVVLYEVVTSNNKHNKFSFLSVDANTNA